MRRFLRHVILVILIPSLWLTIFVMTGTQAAHELWPSVPAIGFAGSLLLGFSVILLAAEVARVCTHVALNAIAQLPHKRG